MDKPHLTLSRLARSTLARSVALWAVAMQVGCYRTWKRRLAWPPPPSTDSITLNYSSGHSVTLYRPEAEGDSVLWGWTRNWTSEDAPILVSAGGVDTIAKTDSTWARVSLFEGGRQLQRARTLALTTLVALGLLVGYTVEEFERSWRDQ